MRWGAYAYVGDQATIRRVSEGGAAGTGSDPPMNAVEIADAVAELAGRPFDPAEFPFDFLAAYGRKETELKRLKSGSANPSDVPGGVLLKSNIHLLVCPIGGVPEGLQALRHSPKTTAAKAKFILATDGEWLEAEELASGEAFTAPFTDLGKHCGFFFPLAGISTVREIRNNPFDVKATGRLNKLYIELVKDNPEWGTDARRPDLNKFMARLIFCFFAEDTGIFHGEGMFTWTLTQMADVQSTNTHLVLAEIFRAMDLPTHRRKPGDLRDWAEKFPYVNGGLFAGSTECPRFRRMARSYLLKVGELDWKDVNPDIFGSMIQAVADDTERGALGMHYTSVPNILKVLNPLFLDDVRDKLAAAGDSKPKLRALRRRLAGIRVFDPACGSGNFLVIAYKEMRAIEHEIVKRTGDEAKSKIRLENFYGIEIKDFAVEVAKLSLLIAEYQCDARYIGQQEAWMYVLPLHNTENIRRGNALRMDWLEVCPPVSGRLVEEHDLAGPTGRLALEDSGADGQDAVETYICGNPPYIGYNRQNINQKSDINFVFSGCNQNFGNLDYVCCWFFKAANYNKHVGSKSAFVSTNSICQGSQVPALWPLIYAENQEIFFARTSFEWSNLATHNAGITVIVLGLQNSEKKGAYLFSESDSDVVKIKCDIIGPYLIPNSNIIVNPQKRPISALPEMILGNHPYYASDLIISKNEAESICKNHPDARKFIRPYLGAAEVIKGVPRYCIWINDDNVDLCKNIDEVSKRVQRVKLTRSEKVNDKTAQALVSRPHRFRDQSVAIKNLIVIPQVSSESRSFLPADILHSKCIISFQAYALFDSPLWALSIIVSRLHWNWIARVCRRMRTDFSYSNTLGWNTFPVPFLTQNQKNALTRCAEDILLAREAHFPATIADLYDPERMPENLRQAHDRNDETIERIYIGRRFKNDTERLEKLFQMYTEMTANKKEAAGCNIP
jgi:N-6 DNA Methylase